jgi:hypothetical protein
MMTTPPVRVERRVGQRFPYLIPVKIHAFEPSLDGAGFTQDLSSRGVFFFTELPLADGMEIELTLRMPSEITLGQSMPVRCKGRVLRTLRPVGQSAPDGVQTNGAETKIGVALRIENYDYLTEAPDPTAARISQIHPDRDEERHWVQSPARS